MASPPPLPSLSSPVLPRTRALICGGINVFAFPGLGTIMAGRKVGFVQAAVMLAGFVLTMTFMLIYISAVYRYAASVVGTHGWTEAELRAHWRPYVGLGLTGAVLCFVAWGWALASTIQFLRRAPQ